MKKSASDILPGAKRNPAPVQSDATRVTPRRPASTTNNPNAATIGPAPSRARQALNAARTVSTTVDAVASAAEAGINLRRGDVAGAVAAAGLAGAAAMGVRSARVAKSARAERLVRTPGPALQGAERMNTIRDTGVLNREAAAARRSEVISSRRSTDWNRPIMNEVIREGNIPPVRPRTAEIASPGTVPYISEAAARRDLSIARAAHESPRTPAGVSKNAAQLKEDSNVIRRSSKNLVHSRGVTTPQLPAHKTNVYKAPLRKPK